MGFFGKIKNILFEDDDEVEDMPVYTKDEIKNDESKKEIVREPEIPIEPIKTSDSSHFRNVKRDIDLNFDEKDVLDEVPRAGDTVKNVELPVKKEEDVVSKEEKKSPFLSFDADEFERLNSRVNKNEERVRKEVKSVAVPVNTARKANNNFSSTSTNYDTRIENTERYKINSGTLGSGKKPFTPSPVISPVYGILDRNYKIDDIVDRQGGIKREKVVKPVVRNEEKSTNVVDIDSVRKKAYGELEDLESTLTKIEIPELKNDDEEKEEITIINVKQEDKVEKDSSFSAEEELDTTKNDTVSEVSDDDLDKTVNEVIGKNEVEKVVSEPAVTKKKPKVLDELEKTSTLQILDDIEKELNSIKPIANNNEIHDEEINNDVNDDTLESDLFNLIDSMYEEGEEDEDD